MGQFEEFPARDEKNTTAPDDPGNLTGDFHGQRRSNQTHASKTDRDAQLAWKVPGKEANPGYSGNLLAENCKGLMVNSELLEANGRAERDAAVLMLEYIPARRG